MKQISEQNVKTVFNRYFNQEITKSLNSNMEFYKNWHLNYVIQIHPTIIKFSKRLF